MSAVSAERQIDASDTPSLLAEFDCLPAIDKLLDDLTPYHRADHEANPISPRIAEKVEETWHKLFVTSVGLVLGSSDSEATVETVIRPKYVELFQRPDALHMATDNVLLRGELVRRSVDTAEQLIELCEPELEEPHKKLALIHLLSADPDTLPPYDRQLAKLFSLWSYTNKPHNISEGLTRSLEASTLNSAVASEILTQALSGDAPQDERLIILLHHDISLIMVANGIDQQAAIAILAKPKSIDMWWPDAKEVIQKRKERLAASLMTQENLRIAALEAESMLIPATGMSGFYRAFKDHRKRLRKYTDPLPTTTSNRGLRRALRGKADKRPSPPVGAESKIEQDIKNTLIIVTREGTLLEHGTVEFTEYRDNVFLRELKHDTGLYAGGQRAVELLAREDLSQGDVPAIKGMGVKGRFNNSKYRLYEYAPKRAPGGDLGGRHAERVRLLFVMTEETNTFGLIRAVHRDNLEEAIAAAS